MEFHFRRQERVFCHRQLSDYLMAMRLMERLPLSGSPFRLNTTLGNNTQLTRKTSARLVSRRPRIWVHHDRPFGRVSGRVSRLGSNGGPEAEKRASTPMMRVGGHAGVGRCRQGEAIGNNCWVRFESDC